MKAPITPVHDQLMKEVFHNLQYCTAILLNYGGQHVAMLNSMFTYSDNVYSSLFFQKMCTNLYGQEVLIFMIYLLPVLQNIMDNLLTVQEVRVNCKYHCFHLSAYHWFYSEYRIFLITSRYKQEAKKIYPPHSKLCVQILLYFCKNRPMQSF